MSVSSFLQNQRGGRPFFYLLIEGIGVKDGTEAKQLYTFTRVPGWSPSSTQKFISGLHIPGSTTQSGDLWGGLAQGGRLKVEVQDFQQSDGTYFWCSMFATGKWIQDPTTYPQAFLTQTLTPENAEVVTDSRMYSTNNSLFPPDTASNADRTLNIGLETIRYDSLGHTPGVIVEGAVVGEKWWFEGLHRGLFPCVTPDTIHALEHRIHDFNDAQQPVITTHPRVWVNRMASVYVGLEYPDGSWSPENESVRLFTGPIALPEWSGSDFRWTIELEDLVSSLKQRTCCAWIGSKTATAESGTQEQPKPDIVGSTRILGINLDPSDALGSIIRKLTIDVTRSEITATIDGLDVDVSESVHTSSATATAHTFYPYPADLPTDLSTQLSQFDDDIASYEFVMTAGGRATVRVTLAPDPANTATLAATVKVRMGGALAMALGFNDSGNAAQYIAEATAEADETVTFDGEFTAYESCACFLSRSTDVKLGVEDTTPLLDAQGDGANPAVLIGNKWIARYSARSTVTDRGNISYPALRIITRTRIQAGDYGAQHWPGGLPIIGRRMDAGEDDDQDDGSVRQVIAPHPDNSWADQMRHFIVSTGYGQGGAYDVFPPNVGAGLWSELVDLASFDTVQTAIDTAMARRSYVIQGSFPLSELLDKEGKLLGVMIVVRNGKITARTVPSLTTAANAGTIALTDSNKDAENDRTSSTLPPDNIINAITVLFNWHAKEKKYLGRANLAFPVSQSENQLVRTQSLESKGLFGDWWQSFGVALLTNLVLRQHLYGWPLWTIRRSINFNLWRQLSPGDVVLLTDSSVPDPFTGNIGVTNVLLALTKVTENYHGAGGDVEGVILNMPSSRAQNVGPSGILDTARGDGGWDSATRTMYLKANEYTVAPDTDRDSFGSDINGYAFRVTDQSATDPSSVSALVISHPTLAAQYTNGITLVPILPEGDLNARLPGGFVNGHRYVVTEDPYSAYTLDVSGELPGISYDFAGQLAGEADGAYIADDSDAAVKLDAPFNPWKPYT